MVALLRLARLLATTAFYYSLVVVGRWGRRTDRAAAWRRRIFQRWGRAVVRLLRMRSEVRGEPPRPPFLLVANHLSYVDIPLLAAEVPGIVFVAKAEIRGWPLFGRICRGMGTVFTDRASKRDLLRANAAVEEALARGDGVVLFPESTTSTGQGMLPFKAPLLEVAVRTGRPVYWACLTYHTASGPVPAERLVPWVGGQELLPHARRLLAHPGFEATLSFCAQPILDGDRKRLAERLREAMSACFLPTSCPSTPRSSSRGR